jgi:predicted negative regulator of RcsB-dependent stress response
MRGALLAKLQAAQTAIERGQKATAIAQLNQFISMVQGDAGKKIDAGLAGRLASWAQDLIGRL